MGDYESQRRIGRQQILRRRCAVIAQALPLPNPFDLQQFIASLSVERGRPIILHTWEFDGLISGLLVSSLDADYVLVELQTTPLHQRQIAIHELAHLICGHQPQLPLSNTSMYGQSGLLRDDLVRFVLQRGGYHEVEEQEAELLASLIMERITEQAYQQEGHLDRTQDAAIDRVRSTLVGDGSDIS